MRARVKVFFDGGYRPSTVGMETAVVVRAQVYFQRDLGPGSSMDAEWLALIHAVTIAAELRLPDAVFLGDSLAVIGQANGTAKCRGAYLRHLEALKGASPLAHIRYVKRTQNLAGIALERLRA